VTRGEKSIVGARKKAASPNFVQKTLFGRGKREEGGKKIVAQSLVKFCAQLKRRLVSRTKNRASGLEEKKNTQSFKTKRERTVQRGLIS